MNVGCRCTGLSFASCFGALKPPLAPGPSPSQPLSGSCNRLFKGSYLGLVSLSRWSRLVVVVGRTFWECSDPAVF